MDNDVRVEGVTRITIERPSTINTIHELHQGVDTPTELHTSDGHVYHNLTDSVEFGSLE